MKTTTGQSTVRRELRDPPTSQVPKAVVAALVAECRRPKGSAPRFDSQGDLYTEPDLPAVAPDVPTLLPDGIGDSSETLEFVPGMQPVGTPVAPLARERAPRASVPIPTVPTHRFDAHDSEVLSIARAAVLDSQCRANSDLQKTINHKKSPGPTVTEVRVGPTLLILTFALVDALIASPLCRANEALRWAVEPLALAVFPLLVAVIGLTLVMWLRRVHAHPVVGVLVALITAPPVFALAGVVVVLVAYGASVVGSNFGVEAVASGLSALTGFAPGLAAMWLLATAAAVLFVNLATTARVLASHRRR